MLSISSLHRLERELGAGNDDGADRTFARPRRRRQGAYFTPEPLARFVVDHVIDALGPLTYDRYGIPAVRIVDPAAGDGRFLSAAVDRLVRLARARGPGASLRERITRRCVIGIERDPELATLARARLGRGAKVHCCEAILGAPDLGTVDAVIGNPPYQRSIHFARSDPALWQALRGRFAATSHGEWDLYAVFLERALEWVRPGGQVGLVVPSRWLTAAFARRLRAKLAEQGAVRAIVDFGARQIFEGATTYASVAFLSRRRADSNLERTRQRAAVLVNLVQVARRSEEGWTSGAIDGGSLGAEPWRLSVGARRSLLERLGERGPALGEVARIAKGTGTNADRVFVIEQARVCGDLIAGHSRQLDRRVELEAALLRPCLRGRDVHSFGAADPSVQLLVPYDPSGALLPPEILAARYPRAWEYLSACREVLEARERGRFRGDRFYCFGRAQNLRYLFDPAPKIVVPDVARGGRALLDPGAAMVLDSAYAIRPLPDSDVWPELLLAVLNSPIVELWLRETGVPLRGGYLRMKTAYLRSLPLPDVSTWAAIDPADLDTLRCAYGIDAETWGAINRRARPDRAARRAGR